MLLNNSTSSTGVSSKNGSETEREELPQKDRKWYRNPLVQVIAGLVVLVIVLIVILSGLLITRRSDAPRVGELNAQKPEEKSPAIRKIPDAPSRQTCKTPACITLAHELHNWADPSVDPCVDFYKATCGKYTEHTLTEGNMFKKKEIINKRLVKDFIRENTTSPSSSGNSMRVIYQKCEGMKDARYFTNEFASSVKQITENIDKIGTWPLIDRSATLSGTYLTDMMVNMANLSVPTFGWLKITTDFMRLNIWPAQFASNNYEKLKAKIDRILKAKNVKIDEKLIETDINEAMAIGQSIFKLGKMRKGVFLNYENVRESWMDLVDLDRIIEAVAYPQRWAKEAQRIWIRDFELFIGDNLKNIIKSASPRTIANMLIFQYIDHFGDQFFDGETSRKRDCLQFVMDTLPQSALYAYIQRHSDSENMKLVSEMVEELKVSYVGMVGKSTWLSDKLKENTLEKVKKMSKIVGVPENWEKQLEANHRKLNLQPTDSFFSIIAKIVTFKVQNSISNMINGVLFSIEDDLLQGNAFYHWHDNHLRIFNTLLSSPIFDATFPVSARLGGIGTVAGHEIGHSFDTDAIYHDEHGKWNSSRLEKEDKEKYTERIGCFIDEYNSYNDPVYGRNLNGSITINEMISDNLGYRAAWITYKRLSTSADPDIIGFEGRSHDEMFFRAVALNRCSVKDTLPLGEKLRLQHPTPSFRVNGVVSNMKAFAETFNCPLGSPMNPAKKCELF